MKQILHHIFRGLLIVFALGVVLFILYKIYITSNVGDDIIMDDTHMIPKMMYIEDSKNGWSDLKKAENLMYFPDDRSDQIGRMATGEDWDDIFAQELIAKNQEAILHFDAALQKEKIVNPSQNIIDLKNVDVDFETNSMLHLRQLVKIRTIGALYYFRDGQNVKGTDELHKISQLCYILSQNESPFVFEVLMNMSMQNIVGQAYQYVLTKNELSNEDLKMVHKNRIEIDNRNSLSHAFQLEYVVMKNSHNKMMYDPTLLKENSIDVNRMGKNSFFWKPQQTQNMIMRHYEQAMQNSMRACNDIMLYNKPKSIGYISSRLQENSLGRSLIFVTETSYDNVQNIRCGLERQNLMIDVSMAAQMYRSEHGQFPESLSKLDSTGYFTYDISDRMRMWNMKYNALTGQLTQ